MSQKTDGKITVKSLPPFHLKESKGFGGIKLNLMDAFGFVPMEIVIQKMAGQNNRFMVSAVLTAEELRKQAVEK